MNEKDELEKRALENGIENLESRLKIILKTDLKPFIETLQNPDRETTEEELGAFKESVGIAVTLESRIQNKKEPLQFEGELWGGEIANDVMAVVKRHVHPSTLVRILKELREGE